MSELADQSLAQLTLRERLIALVRQILGPPAANRPLPIDARLADLGMSSLKMVSLMLALEVQFEIAIPQEEITPENFASIESVEAVVERLSRPARTPTPSHAGS
ncbi:MAG TPA: phosphopantetheine-binding protein [Steroidobacteraceae bacterium]|nr:phosphopantetheine-binding protein [Steroidobacteraceae bacterium]